MAGLAPERACLRGRRRAGRAAAQIRADVTGLPVTRPDDVETTARGAAMLAAVGAGLHADVRTAAKSMAGPRVEPMLPDPERRGIYSQAHAAYRRLYEAVSPLFGEARGSVRVGA